MNINVSLTLLWPWSIVKISESGMNRLAQWVVQSCKVWHWSHWGDGENCNVNVFDANWSGCFRTALFRALCLSLRLTFRGKRFTILQTLIFTVIIPHTSLYGVCRRLIVGSVHVTRSDATSSNKTLTLFSANFAFHILLCVWISMFIQEKKNCREKKNQNQQKFQCSRRPTASSRQSTANQHQVCNIICICILGETMDFPDLKTSG